MEEKLVKIAISGKGGVGKTTLGNLLAMAYAESGYNAQTDIQGINVFESVPQAAADVKKIKDELGKLF